MIRGVVHVLVLTTLVATAFGDGASRDGKLYLGVPHDKKSSQVKVTDKHVLEMIARHGEIQPVADVDERRFWEDVKAGRAQFIQVLDGALYYACRLGEHLPAPEGVPAPWRPVLGRRRVVRKAATRPAVSEGVIKLMYLTPKEASRIAAETKPIKIKLRYPSRPNQVVEYSHGRWTYRIHCVTARGRSSVHGGIVSYDGAYVMKSAVSDRVTTPFGEMTHMRGKYLTGWWPVVEKNSGKPAAGKTEGGTSAPQGGTAVGIELMGGFGQDEVVVLLDGKQVFKGRVEADPVTGAGTPCGGNVNGTTCELEVRTPRAGVGHKQRISLKTGGFLDVMRIDGKIRIRQRLSGERTYE